MEQQFIRRRSIRFQDRSEDCVARSGIEPKLTLQIDMYFCVQVCMRQLMRLRSVLTDQPVGTSRNEGGDAG